MYDPREIFLNNRYTKKYLAITTRAYGRRIPKDIYTENHHIIPKCLFSCESDGGWLEGSPEYRENKVDLTAHEHLVCHLLLRKMLPDHQLAGVTAAAWRMANMKDGDKRIKVTGRTYAKLREEHAKQHSKTMKGRPAHNKGKRVTEKEKLDNIKKAANERDKVMKTCEHCGKTLIARAYKQYHGDRCEMNPDRDPNLVTVKTRGQTRSKKQKKFMAEKMREYYEENPKRPKTDEEKEHLSKVLTGVPKPKSQGKNISKTVAKQKAEGTHWSQNKKECPHCGTLASSNKYNPYHGENCVANPDGPRYDPVKAEKLLKRVAKKR